MSFSAMEARCRRSPASISVSSSGNTTFFCALNTGNTPADITVTWDSFGWILHGKPFSIRDVWSKKPAGETTRPYTARLDAHDVALLRLSPLK